MNCHIYCLQPNFTIECPFLYRKLKITSPDKTFSEVIWSFSPPKSQNNLQFAVLWDIPVLPLTEMGQHFQETKRFIHFHQFRGIFLCFMPNKFLIREPVSEVTFGWGHSCGKLLELQRQRENRKDYKLLKNCRREYWVEISSWTGNKMDWTAFGLLVFRLYRNLTWLISIMIHIIL